MEARGFGGETPRTWARDSTFGAREVVLIIIGALIAAAAITISVVFGTWNFIVGCGAQNRLAGVT
jgi:energy-coupling factor transport system permease protein